MEKRKYRISKKDTINRVPIDYWADVVVIDGVLQGDLTEELAGSAMIHVADARPTKYAPPRVKLSMRKNK